MNMYVILTCFLFSSMMLAAQNNCKRVEGVWKPDLKSSGIVEIKVSSDYNNSEIELTKDQIANISGKVIESVTYVATYSGNTKLQSRLNKQRKASLLKAIPGLYNNNLIGWNCISHGVNLDAKEKEKLFHGFVIVYRDITEASVKEESDYLRRVLESGSLTGLVEDTLKHKSKITEESSVSRKAIAMSDGTIEYITPFGYDDLWDDSIKIKGTKKLDKTIDSIARHMEISSYEEPSSDEELITIYINRKTTPSLSVTSGTIFYAGGMSSYTAYKPDSTVLKVLDRNKEWKNKLIAHDVTGSMSPYTAQVLLWHKLNFDTSSPEYYVFFNDGDRKRDRAKITGKVGGLYFADNSSTVNDVINVAQKAMSNGGGGDCPENNIEAVIKGLKKYPEAKNVVMIADNYATPRDLSLVKNVGVPIKILLCGVRGSLNLNYMNLAKETGGSIHTIESDITNLMSMKEGEVIEIDGVGYRLVKGKFVIAGKI